MANGWLINKRIVIVGGTEGLGLSAALACVVEGARVVVVGRSREQGEEAARRLNNNGIVVTGDASREGVVLEAIQACIDRFGGMDGLYHVAGGSGRKFGDGPLHEMTEEAWNQTFKLNLTSLMFSNKAALQYFMNQKKGGSIVNMGSVLGCSPSPKYFTTHAYAACKSAVVGLSKAAASWYAPYNIRVNIIAPGLVQTPMAERAVQDESIMQYIKTKQPLDGGRVGMPGDVDGAAVFLLSDHSAFITGQVLAVDGGWILSEGQY